MSILHYLRPSVRRVRATVVATTLLLVLPAPPAIADPVLVAWTNGRVTLVDSTTAQPVWSANLGSQVGGANEQWASMKFDCSNDGSRDVLVKTSLALVALEGSSGSEIWRYTFSTSGISGEIHSVDTNGNGQQEIVVAHNTDNSLAAIYVFTPIGGLLWSDDFGLSFLGWTTVADIDGDGHPEIIGASGNGGPTSAVDLVTRQVKWSFQIGSYEFTPKPAVGDALRNGTMICYRTGYGNRVEGIAPAGTGFWSRTFGSGWDPQAMFVDNLDGTGLTNILVGTLHGYNYGNDLYLLNAANGNTIWQFHHPQAYWSIDIIGLADANVDGILDVICRDGGDDRLFVVDGRTGAMLWEHVSTDSFANAVGDSTNTAYVRRGTFLTWPYASNRLDFRNAQNGDIVLSYSESGNTLATARFLEVPSAAGVVALGRTTQLPMKNVRVDAVDPAQGNPVATAVTNSQGVYSFSSIPDGSWLIRASVPNPTPVPSPCSSPPTTRIANYPDDEPMRAWAFVGGVPVEPIPPIRFPDPVVLQAGWSGLGGGTTPPDSWPEAICYLTADAAEDTDKAANRVPAFLCYENDIYDATATTLNHDANAAVLSAFINGIELSAWIGSAARPDVPFSILAHSMGGLITRSMVTSGGSSLPVVNRIVTLDAPHGGSALAMLGGWRALMERVLNGTRPAGCEPVTEPGWNADHVEPQDSGRTWLLYSCVPAGWVLPDASAWGQGRPWISGFGPELWPDCWLRWVQQGWTVEVTNTHGGVHDDETRLRECALFLAKGTVPPQTPPAAPGPPGDSTDGLGVLAGSLTAQGGESEIETLAFDANTAVHGRVLLWGAGAQYLLIDEFGMPLTLTNLSTEALSDDSWLESFEIVAPAVGSVDVELTSGSSDAELTFGFYFSNENRLIVTTSPSSIPEGSTTLIRAWIEDAQGNVLTGGGGTFTASVQRPDGSLNNVPLFDDGVHGDGAAGDGVFGRRFGGVTTDLQGRYMIDVHGIQDFGDYAVDRSGSGAFAVMPTGASFSGSLQELPVDDDQDGLYDSLDFELGITLTSDGSYKVLGELTEPGGTIGVLAVSFENTSGAGSTTVRLSISGAELVRHGVPGPWTLANLRIVRLDTDSLPTDTAPDHGTQAYALSEFNAPPPPQIGALVPSSGSVFGGYEVVLDGSHLLDAESVLIGDNQADFVVQDDHSLLITIPPMDRFLTAGMKPSIPVDVVVITPWGSDIEEEAFRYRP